LAVIGVGSGMALLATFPASTGGARIMILAGHIGGLLYALSFWAERLGRIASARSGLLLIVLVSVPAIVSALVRVPFGALLYSGGFLAGSTSAMWAGERFYRFLLRRTASGPESGPGMRS
jgi:hypothetical protein